MLVSRRYPSSWSVSSLRRLHTDSPNASLSSVYASRSLQECRQPRLGLARAFHTSLSCLGIPSVSANGQIQTPQYLAAVELISSKIAANYPDGRAVYGPKKKAIPCPSLPPPESIGSMFNIPSTKGRCSLIEPEVARAFVRGALGLDEKLPKGSKKRKEGRVVIETFPGPGGVTRALLELPRSEVKRVIVLEEELKFLPALKELEYYDDRVHVLSQSGFIWETYDIVKEMGLLDDVKVEDWKTAPHSTLSFIGHLPLGPVGEQLIAQLLRAIPERSWLFKYGRMRMSWLLAQRMVERITSPPPKAARCKLTLIAEATAKLTSALPQEALADYDKYFWPKSESMVGGKKKTPLPRRIGQPFVAFNIDPQAEGSILSREEAKEPQPQQIVATNKPITRVTLDKWDYVLRQLFILKSTPLEKAIQNLGPGASILLSKLTGPGIPESRKVDIKAPINALSLQDFARIVEEFHKWPFAPDVLFIADQVEEERN
ncbi:unnamed protein product [Rhizoctonia solani]|uniref:rRNA adenine N(6)-methyltransferase n=2 Tax=Rhizoctonia solani TaxID=456999 RepID=A0A8H3DTY1_9AGAM|nr:unnamed protein product [Rhizoctonia solani]CAE6536236.1 unnamed protein product [Rhizoctonia solani]